MKSFESTCGFPNSGWIYFVGLASFVEALAFTSASGLLISDINTRFGNAVYWNNFFATPRRIAVFILILSCIRILVAIALVAGRYRKILGTLAFFIMFTATGIICNLIAGIMALNHSLSYDLGVATMCMIVLHFVYVFIAIKIYRMERKSSSNTPEIQTEAITPAPPPAPSVPGPGYAASPPALNTPYIQQIPVSDAHMAPPLSPPRYSEHVAGNSSYALESEVDSKKTTIIK